MLSKRHKKNYAETRQRQPQPQPQPQLNHRDAVNHRRVVATQYFDEGSLKTLGLYEHLKNMFSNIGWTHFITHPAPTYPKLTREFLQSVELVEVEPLPLSIMLWTLKFTLNGNEYEIDIEKLNQIFGFPNEPRTTHPDQYNCNEFWNSITGLPIFKASRSKATNIRNPCLRYALKVLSHSIFSRGDSKNSIRSDELFFLWCMLEGMKLNTGYFLAKQFIDVANAPSTTTIGVGGLITSIAIALGVNVGDLISMGPDNLDLKAMHNWQMLEKAGNRYYYLICRGPTKIKLPNKTATNPFTEAGLKFEPQPPILIALQGNHVKEECEEEMEEDEDVEMEEDEGDNEEEREEGGDGEEKEMDEEDDEECFPINYQPPPQYHHHHHQKQQYLPPPNLFNPNLHCPGGYYEAHYPNMEGPLGGLVDFWGTLMVHGQRLDAIERSVQALDQRVSDYHSEMDARMTSQHEEWRHRMNNLDNNIQDLTNMVRQVCNSHLDHGPYSLPPPPPPHTD